MKLNSILVHQILKIFNPVLPYLFIFSMLFFIPEITFSQLAPEWVSRFNGPGNYIDMVNSMTIDNKGNIYVTGQSYSSASGFDYCTIKYNSAGVQKWVAYYNGPGNTTDIAYGIAVDATGNVYVTGTSCHGYRADTEDFATIKYDSSGVQQWVARYNGATDGPDQAVGIVVDINSNCYVTGYSYSNATNYDYVTIKYNSSGVQQWLVLYNGPVNGGDEPTFIALDQNSNLYVTGNSHGNGTANDYCTIKYSIQGVQQWVARYDGPASGDDIPYSLAVDGSLNVIVTGRSPGINSDGDYATVKYNASGTQQWVQRFNGSGNNNDIARSVITDNSNNIYVTGSATGSSTGSDFCTIKYNPAGVQQWVATYDGPIHGSDEASALGIDSIGNIYAGGYSYGSGTSADFCIVKYDQSGVQKSVNIYNGPGNSGDYITSMSVLRNGIVYVAGFSQGAGTNYDFTTIKYSPVTGIKPISGRVPDHFVLYQNYPNPFNPSTVIKFDNPASSRIKLSVFDVLGKETAVLVDKELPAGSYEYLWDASSLSSGIYFYKIDVHNTANLDNDYTQIKKMILVK
jgi:uncharacterized delta-60 repeat protein